MGAIQKNNSGFGAVEVLILLLVLGIIGLVGWYGLRARKVDTPIQTSNHTQTKAPVYHTFVADNVIAPYVLPDGWSSLNCGTDTVYLFVPSVKTYTNCDGNFNQPENPKSPDFTSMGTYNRDINHLDTRSCANTIHLIYGNSSPDPANDYACKDVTIGSKKGLRQTVTHTTQSAQTMGIPSVDIIYDLPAGNGLMFEASYTHYLQSPYPDVTKQFDAFITSLKFK